MKRFGEPRGGGSGRSVSLRDRKDISNTLGGNCWRAGVHARPVFSRSAQPLDHSAAIPDPERMLELGRRRGGISAEVGAVASTPRAASLLSCKARSSAGARCRDPGTAVPVYSHALKRSSDPLAVHALSFAFTHRRTDGAGGFLGDRADVEADNADRGGPGGGLVIIISRSLGRPPLSRGNRSGATIDQLGRRWPPITAKSVVFCHGVGSCLCFGASNSH
jgi:hypothetical protein